MEDLKSAALTEDWRNFSWNTKGDIFEIIKRAIMVAASDHPTEFRTRRHEIVRTLFSSEFMMCTGCDNGKKHSPKMSKQTEETKIIGEDLMMKDILDKSADESESLLVVPVPPTEQLVPTCKQQRPTILKLNTETQFPIPKGPVTPENKDIGLGTRGYSQGVVEVLRMKLKIRDKSGDQSESESVCDLVTKLDSMMLSVNSNLEATEIGKSFDPLKKHASKNVDQIARTLIKECKSTVDEWTENQSSVDCVVEPTSQQVKPTNLHLYMERKLEVSEKALKIGDGGVTDSMEKPKARKRKLQEEFQKVENMKKKRRIQVMSCMESPSMAFFPI
ncbi:hypothetical protein Lser_V15G33588 [Lactuca serriola]